MLRIKKSRNLCVTEYDGLQAAMRRVNNTENVLSELEIELEKIA